MGKKRTFISFDYDHDLDLKNLLVGQARNTDSPFEITDMSIKETIAKDWKANARRRIKGCDVVIVISQLKFLYPLKTLVFPAFSPPRFGPFPSFFPLREEMRETFFRPSLQPYPAALRKFAWPLWWRGRKCSSWYLHQNVPAAPAHPWVLPREREGWSYMYASTDGSENHPYPRSSFGSIGIRC